MGDKDSLRVAGDVLQDLLQDLVNAKLLQERNPKLLKELRHSAGRTQHLVSSAIDCLERTFFSQEKASDPVRILTRWNFTDGSALVLTSRRDLLQRADKDSPFVRVFGGVSDREAEVFVIQKNKLFTRTTEEYRP